MESNAAGVLSALSQRLLHVHANVRQLEGGLQSLNRVKLAVFGGLSIAAGAGLLGMVKSTVDASRDLNRQLTTTRTLMSDPVRSVALAAQALAVARNTTRDVRGMPIDKAVEIFNESFSLMGAKNAAKVNSVLARYAMVSGGASGNYDNAFDNIRELLKSGELSGQILDKKTHEISTNKLLGFLDLASRASAATGNRINARTFFQIAQQGGTALNNMSQDGILGVLMAAQDMGGFRAGTATMSAFSQFAGGVMTKQKADELKKLGLVGGYHTVRGGGVQFDKGSLNRPFEDALRHDPLQAVKILRDALTSHGITGEKQTEEVFKIFSRQTVQRLFSDWLNGYQQKLDERGRILGAQGLNQQDKTRNDNDYDRNLHNLTTEIDNFKKELGNAMTPAAIDVLKKMTDGVRYLKEEAIKLGPDRLADTGKGIAILGASLVTAGAAALVLAAGPGGWLVLGILALGGAVAAFAPDQFHEWLGGLWKLTHGLGMLNWREVAAGIGQEFSAAFHLLPTDARAWIKSAVHKIGDFFNAAVTKLASWLPGQVMPAVPKDSNQAPSLTPEAFSGPSPLSGGELTRAAFGGDNGGKGRVVAGTIAGGISNSNVVIMGGVGLGNGAGHGSGGMMPIGPGSGHAASREPDRARLIHTYARKISAPAPRVAPRQSGNSSLDSVALHVRNPYDSRREHGASRWHTASDFRSIEYAPPVPKRAPQKVHQHTNVLLDGRPIASSVTVHDIAAQAASAPGSHVGQTMRAV